MALGLGLGLGLGSGLGLGLGLGLEIGLALALTLGLVTEDEECPLDVGRDDAHARVAGEESAWEAAPACQEG